jgi:type VI secretion system protein ImpH
VVSASRRTDPLVTDASVEDALFERGYEFEFFQAVRLLSRVFPRRRAVGTAAKPVEEIARFGVQRSIQAMVFPASAIDNIEKIAGSPDPAAMTIAFLGLTGTQGVLPLCYTEHMVARAGAKPADDTLAAFLDLFNHRLISLFYRAWEKHRPPVLYELGAIRGQQPDPFTQNLFDLIGMGTEGLRGRMGVRDESLLLYAGLLAQRPHSAAALRGILQDYFGVAIEIDQCLGSWYELEEVDRCYLAPAEERSQLGVGTFIGAEVWDQQARFRVRVGPLSLKGFTEFLPEGPVMAKLVELTRYIAGNAMVFDVQVFLKADHVPLCQLSDEGAAAPRLGWMSWLRTDEFTEAAGDAVSTWVM